MKRLFLSLALFTAIISQSHASTIFLYGTTTDPSGKQVDKFSVHVEGPTMLLGVRFLPNDQPQPKVWLDTSLYLLNKDGTAVGGGHGDLFSDGTFGAPLGGITPVVPEGDYDLYFTSYSNKAFDAKGNSLFGGLAFPGEPTYRLELNPDAGPLDHFALDGPTPGNVDLGDYMIVFVTEPQTPEPSTLLLLGIGIAGMAGYAWKRGINCCC